MLIEEPEHSRGARKERILRVLLVHTDEDLTKATLTRRANVSGSWFREYTNRLDRRGLIQGTKVVRPQGLYEEWESIRPPRTHTTVSLQQPEQVLRETELEYALTTYKAENLHQGFLFPSRTDIYIRREQIQSWLDVIENRGMIGGGNTRLWIADEQVFYEAQRLQGLQTVSIPQLIMDLRAEGGPGVEAAEKLYIHYHGAEC